MGLGPQAQQSCVADFARYGQHEIIASYQGIETGKRADRPELAKAIAHAKRAKATLVIAKLDRLARNVHFLSGLMESRVDFVCCDNPHANRLTLHILAAVAEDEARRISERTKAALAAFKARGGKLGTPANLTPEAARRGSEATQAKPLHNRVVHGVPKSLGFAPGTDDIFSVGIRCTSHGGSLGRHHDAEPERGRRENLDVPPPGWDAGPDGPSHALRR